MPGSLLWNGDFFNVIIKIINGLLKVSRELIFIQRPKDIHFVPYYEQVTTISSCKTDRRITIPRSLCVGCLQNLNRLNSFFNFWTIIIPSKIRTCVIVTIFTVSGVFRILNQTYELTLYFLPNMRSIWTSDNCLIFI